MEQNNGKKTSRRSSRDDLLDREHICPCGKSCIKYNLRFKLSSNFILQRHFICTLKTNMMVRNLILKIIV